jgi:hypothetical protein
MGIAPRRLGRSSAPLTFGAGVLACVLAFPTVGEAARFSAHPLAPNLTDCVAERPDRVVIRGVWPCSRSKQIAARPIFPERKAKARKGLTSELYCRLSPTDVSELTRDSGPLLPYSSPHRLVYAALQLPLEWRDCALSPDLDSQEVEGFPVGRLPDG